MTSTSETVSHEDGVTHRVTTEKDKSERRTEAVVTPGHNPVAKLLLSFFVPFLQTLLPILQHRLSDVDIYRLYLFTLLSCS